VNTNHNGDHDMLATLMSVFIVGLAAGYLVRAWQTGSIFSHWIADLEDGALLEIATEKQFGPKVRWLAEKIQDLLLCPLCLVPYVAATLWLLWALCPLAGLAVVVVFASAQVAYFCRTHEPR